MYKNNLTTNEICKYTYSGDKLLSFDGQDCVYDKLGNPTEYRKHKLKWSHLRNLQSFDDIEFRYNSNGLRISKQVDNTKTNYYWANDRLLSEKRTQTFNSYDPVIDDDLLIITYEKNIQYLYGISGVIGIIIDGVPYYYRKNILGDITHICDAEGNIKAEYKYDAWGNHEIIIDIDGIGSLNPFRYRSYYSDTDINLYYLKSRYYDTETGRFINADDINMLNIISNQINGLNLYAYCGNNSVMNVDPSGLFFSKIGNWFNDNVIKPVNNNVIKPIVSWVDNNIVQPTHNSIIHPIGSWINNSIIQPVRDWIVNATFDTWNWITGAVNWVWNKTVLQMFHHTLYVFNWSWNAYQSPEFGFASVFYSIGMGIVTLNPISILSGVVRLAKEISKLLPKEKIKKVYAPSSKINLIVNPFYVNI